MEENRIRNEEALREQVQESMSLTKKSLELQIRDLKTDMG